MAKGAAAGYNAGMEQIEKWLREGGRVVAASERAARAVAAEFHRARRAEGLAAWVAPAVESWAAFVQAEWLRRGGDGRLVLNPLQEEALWVRVIAAGGDSVGLLEGPLRRLAGMAAEAHELLCGYAPRFLDGGARRGWQQDAGAFSGWLAEFGAACAANEAVSAARVAVELAALLKADAGEREALLLVGFDRMTTGQREVLEAWGAWSAAEMGTAAGDVAYFRAKDAQAELAACAAWCRRELEAKADARLLVVTQEAKLRRGEWERAFLREGVEFEFSLGVPLAQVALVRCALMLLRWLEGTLEEREVDWIFSSLWIGSAEERAGLQRAHRELRRCGRERTEWTLAAWLKERGLPEAWAGRMKAARELLRASAKKMAPVEWCALAARLLEAMGWPGGSSGGQGMASADFQALRRWERALDACGSLGFDGRRVEWREFLKELEHAAETTLFAAESEEAPVLVAGPAESAGLTADAVWFAGADEDAWPARGSMNPLIPAEAQKAAGMPHATAQLDAELARAITARLMASTRPGSAGKVRLSYAKAEGGIEKRASRLITELAGGAWELPPELAERNERPVLAERVEDTGRIPLAPNAAERPILVQGGAAALTAQSQCPFQAFATFRLNARGWNAAQAGLTAMARGNLLHEVMHAIWSGPPGGIRTRDELRAMLPDVEEFVARHVHAVMEKELPAAARDGMPQAYLDMEGMRLTGLVVRWLEYEAGRHPFEVIATEKEANATVDELRFQLRVDRLDRLDDGSLMVVDYKTGEVSAREWDPPRPEDVQLPLYAVFTIPADEVGGLVFAKIRPEKVAFEGRARQAKDKLLPKLDGRYGLVKTPLTDGMLEAWRAEIASLAADFAAGKADVDPKDADATCKSCRLHAVCRVRERMNGGGQEEDADE